MMSLQWFCREDMSQVAKKKAHRTNGITATAIVAVQRQTVASWKLELRQKKEKRRYLLLALT